MENPIFEVYVNDELVTKAAINAEFGVLSMITTWVKRQKLGDECLDITVSGLDSVDDRNLSWYGSALKLGDEVRLKITNEGEIAAPTTPEGWSKTKEQNPGAEIKVLLQLEGRAKRPHLKRLNARKWDVATLTHERRDVVDPIYKRQSVHVKVALKNLALGNNIKGGGIFFRLY